MIDTTSCSEYFQTVLEKAKEMGPRVTAQLQDKLHYLDEYACRPSVDELDPARTRCVLYKDFAPLSFTFSMFKRGGDGEYKFWFNGGLIFFANDSSWSVHT